MQCETRKKVDHKIDIRSTSLLKYAVIYGANAAGKSNLVEAFRFIQYCVIKAIPAQSATMFCKSEENNSQKASLDICTPQTSLTSFEYYYDEASLTTINELIKTFDTGISKVSIGEISQDELKKELPEEWKFESNDY